MDINIITYLACICFIFVFGRIFILPLKKIFKLIFNSILGGVCIFIINLVGTVFEFHIGLNFFTSIIVRIIRFTRCNLFNYCKVINWINFYKLLLIYNETSFNLFSNNFQIYIWQNDYYINSYNNHFV